MSLSKNAAAVLTALLEYQLPMTVFQVQLRADVPPDEVARIEMTRRAWAKLDLGASDEARSHLVRSTDGRSGAYLFDLADEAGREAIVDGLEVGPKHVRWALDSVPVPDEFSDPLANGRRCAHPRDFDRVDRLRVLRRVLGSSPEDA